MENRSVDNAAGLEPQSQLHGESSPHSIGSNMHEVVVALPGGSLRTSGGLTSCVYLRSYLPLCTSWNHVVPVIALQVPLRTSGLAFSFRAGTAARNLFDHTLTMEL